MKLVTVEEMRSIEAKADANGLSFSQMMQNAGAGLAGVVKNYYSPENGKMAIGLVGSGNNGGDTLVALTDLTQNGWETSAYLVKSRTKTDPLMTKYLEAGGISYQFDLDQDFYQLDELLENSCILLDGIFGTGVKLPLKPEITSLLEHVRQFSPLPHVIAVDCPSGVDCNTGAAAQECVPAEKTVCMAAVKTGLLNFPAFELAGDIQVIGIGLDEHLSEWQDIKRTVLDDIYIKNVLPVRKIDAHKGTFGTAVIAAGSINYTGAAYLAAKAAYRVGTGLVRLAVPSQLQVTLAGHLPEATWIILPQEMGVIASSASNILLRNLQKATALLIGPGIGDEETTLDFIRKILIERKSHHKSNIGFMPSAKQSEEIEPAQPLPPLVVDADGLRLLAHLPNWHKDLPASTILTPHAGEMSAMTGLGIDEIQSNRLGIAESFAKKWGHIIVLKGALTVVAAPDGSTSVIPVATAALARAGTGDVLAGIITGLLAQGIPPFKAASAGAWIHAQAGLIAGNWIGSSASVLASDVLECIPEVLQELE
jgi:NAD(P)H-hydrate epimerase